MLNFNRMSHNALITMLVLGSMLVVPLIHATPASAMTVDDVKPNKIRKNMHERIAKMQKKEAKDPRKAAELAEYYFQGLGMSTNSRSRALSLYQRASAAGDAVAIYKMGGFYINGLDVDFDGVYEIKKDANKGRALQQQAISGVERLAKKEDGEALYLMGMVYRSGRFGYSRDSKKARSYFKKGADKDYAKARYMFGEVLLTEGSKKFRDACDQFAIGSIMGYGAAQHALAICLERGRGRNRDYNLARTWFNNAAASDYIPAMLKQGSYYLGINNDTSKQKGIAYLKQAEAAGSTSVYSYYALHADDSKKAYFYQWALGYNLNSASYLKEVQTRREKDDKGRDEVIGLEPRVYTRADIMAFAEKAAGGHAGATEYMKDFMLMGYVKSLAPVTLRTLSDGLSNLGANQGARDKPLSFGDGDTTLRYIHEFVLSGYGYQEVISTWDIATKELIQIRALDTGLDINSVSEDGNTFVLAERTQEFWNNYYTHDEKATLRDSTTNELLKTLLSSDGSNISYRDTTFVGQDKYINVNYEKYEDYDKKMHDRHVLFDAKTGEIIAQDIAEVDRWISPNGIHIITKTRVKGAEGEDDVVTLTHSKAPNWSGGTKLEGIYTFSDSKFSFSADSRYLTAGTYLYDLENDKDLGQFGDSDGTLEKLTSIPGTDLMLQKFTNVLRLYKFNGPSLVQVSSVPMDVNWSTIKREQLLSSDYTQIAINGVREGNTNYEIYVQGITLPSDEVVAAKIKAYEEDELNDAALEGVMEMFDAGFEEQALEGFKSLVASTTDSVGPTFTLFLKRKEYSPTIISAGLKAAVDIHLAKKQMFSIGVFLQGEKGAEGTGDAVIKTFSLFNSNLQRAGAQAGDKIVSVNGRPYFRNSTQQVKDYLDNLKAGDNISMVIERAGERRQIQYKVQAAQEVNGLLSAIREIFWHGLLANAAGHPDIADRDADRLSEILDQRIFTKGQEIFGPSLRQKIVALRSVALASRGKMKEAYNVLLNEPAMKTNKGLADIESDMRSFRDLFADLYKEPKKLAYILGKKVEDLPKIDEDLVKPAAYWTLDGRLIEPGIAVLTKKDGGAVID